MRVIGLTGGIGTGKSAVAGMLRELGASVVDADRVGHEAYRPGTDGWRAVVDAFGCHVLTTDGEVDRKRLGEVIFGDSQARNRLNAILHPRMYRMVEQRLDELRVGGANAAVLEAAILIEAKWTPLVDEVWVVTSSEELVMQRLQGRRGLSVEQIRARFKSQLSFAERSRDTDVIIENDGNLMKLRETVRFLWSTRVNGRT